MVVPAWKVTVRRCYLSSPGCYSQNQLAVDGEQLQYRSAILWEVVPEARLCFCYDGGQAGGSGAGVDGHDGVSRLPLYCSDTCPGL